jgi:hypothetical protein
MAVILNKVLERLKMHREMHRDELPAPLTLWKQLVSYKIGILFKQASQTEINTLRKKGV